MQKPASADRIRYDFRDASVPPPHHRSYTIDISPEAVRVTVDCYGEVLSDTTAPLPAGKWQALTGLLRSLPAPGAFFREGMTGTTGHSIRLFAGGEETYRLVWDNASAGRAGEAAEAFVAAVRKAVPNLRELTA